MKTQNNHIEVEKKFSLFSFLAGAILLLSLFFFFIILPILLWGWLTFGIFCASVLILIYSYRIALGISSLTRHEDMAGIKRRR